MGLAEKRGYPFGKTTDDLTRWKESACQARFGDVGVQVEG